MLRQATTMTRDADGWIPAIQCADAWILLSRVSCAIGFRQYASAIGSRIDGGDSADAMFLLQDVGASPKVAWEVVDGWPSDKDFGTSPVDTIFNSRQHKAVVRLAHYIPGFDQFDWSDLLVRGIRRLVDAKRTAS